MSAMCISAAVLWTLLVEISARVLTTTDPADLPLLSPRHYQYKNPDSGSQLVCDKCPAGTYVSVHCSLTAVRECSPCPEGTFTRGENGVAQCHHCGALCPAGLFEKVPCTTTQDRVCTCPPNSFLLVEGGTECKPYSLCPPGTRVKKRGSETEDVICKPCTKGTFSNAESSALKCRAHADCRAQGLTLLIAGTRETDNLCGPLSTAPSSASSSTATAQGQELVTSESSSSPLDHKGVDILKLVAAQVGPQWIDIYQSLANGTEREVAAFSSGYSSDHERAYAALQHWTIRDSDPNLAKLINALHRQRRIDVVEKIRLVMEDNPQFDINQLMTSVNVSQSLSPIHKPPESPSSIGGSAVGVEQSPVDRTKGFFHDESEPLLRCDSTSSKDSALSRNGSFITKEKKDTVLRQVRLDPCDLQPIFDDMLHILNPEELHVIEEIPAAEDKLDQLFEIAGVKSQEASQTLLDSVYSHLPDLL
ncbi:tumor necrosis factor receptor superfamily member 21 isoform X2 [Phyllopteryx taeniolatus]|uniref:tumor necrosis factor receptor superfamily member 21 isoform X2 n=1 Tax=Phyllopteryx taeniolatus TaxID=161469 RepID=UPI002AD55F6E|nr:tumor necrosis factor receptor superfamily member 21 isoform X2 [Phyllopteryx taeniolatus]